MIEMGGSVDGKEGTKNHPPIFSLMIVVTVGNISANIKNPYLSNGYA